MASLYDILTDIETGIGTQIGEFYMPLAISHYYTSDVNFNTIFDKINEEKKEGWRSPIQNKLEDLLKLKKKESWKIFKTASEEEHSRISEMAALVGGFNFKKYLKHRNPDFRTLWTIYFGDVPESDLRSRAQYLDNRLDGILKDY